MAEDGGMDNLQVIFLSSKKKEKKKIEVKNKPSKKI